MDETISDDGQALRCVYYSLDELADAAERRAGKTGEFSEMLHWRKANLPQAARLARTGWEEMLPEALAIAESAVDTVEKEHEIQVFTPTWDVTGAEVDVARYLSGEPENMIDYPMAEISKHGKVITLCASISYSGSVQAEDIERRGQVLCALALLLSRLGYASELWISMTAESRRGQVAECKVMVKSPNDTLDPSRVMFAYAHPAVLRTLMFAWQDGMPSDWKQALRVPGNRGIPGAPIQDLPEGTIYLPEVRTARGAPDAAKDLKALLVKIGLITE